MKKLTLSCSLVGLIALAPAHAAQRTATDEELAAVIEMLRSPNPVVRTRGACTRKVFDANATAAIPALVRLLNDAEPVAPQVCRQDQRQWWGDERPTTPGEEAARALVRIGPASLDSLIRVVRDGGSAARRNSAWALGALDDERSVDALMTALRDQDEAVREQAAWALGAIDDARAVPALLTALRDASAGVRHQAAWALGAIDDARAVDALVSALQDSDARTREQGAWALGAIGDARAAAGLAAALKDSDARVRRQVAWALGAMAR